MNFLQGVQKTKERHPDVGSWFMVHSFQASNFRKATNAMAYIVPGLGLGAPLKDSHRLCDFLMEVPLTDMKVPCAKDKWPWPFESKTLGLVSACVLVGVCTDEI